MEEIGLDTEVLFVEKSHEVAKSRFIYVNKRLVELPSDFSVLYKRKEPFSRPLVWAMFRDLFARRKVGFCTFDLFFTQYCNVRVFS